MNELAVPSRLKWVAVTVGVALVAVPLSFLVWRTPPGTMPPPPSVLPLFVPIAIVIPALSLGLGVAFQLFGRKLLRTDQPSRLSRATFMSITWLLVNWWPHSNFHRVASGWTNIVLIDYFFHTTVIIATCIVAVYFLRVLRVRQDAGPIASGARDAAFASIP